MPSSKQLAAELADMARDIYIGEEELTVNLVRQRVEQKLGLDEGFFQEDNWKRKSRQIIKQTLDELDAELPAPPAPVATPKVEAQPKRNDRKRSATDENTPPAKKRQTAKPMAAVKSESELSEQSNLSEASEKPAKRKRVTKRAGQKSTRTIASDSEAEQEKEDIDGLSEASEKPAKRKRIAKRVDQKSTKTVASDSEEEQEKDLDSSEPSEAEAEPKKRTTKKASPKKTRTKKAEAEPELDSEPIAAESDSPLSELADEDPEIKTDVKKPEPADESSESEVFDEPPKRKRKSKQPSAKKPAGKPSKAKPGTSKSTAAESDSPLSELADEDSGVQTDVKKPEPADESSESEVFDEPPKRKRKSKEPATKKSAGKSSKPKTSASKSTADVSPDDAEIKKLQSQLVKCGVRKIWAFELKQYGDDSRAKIRHLKGMLKDIGMDGRFSESKAREIKERRELLADLEEVQEMSKNWGSGDGRNSRSRAARPKKLVVDDDDDDDEEDSAPKDDSDGDEDEDEGPRNPRAAAIAKRRADFAFLGDEEESD